MNASCESCRHFRPAREPHEDGPGDPPACNWAPHEDYPLWVGNVVGHWLSDDDIATAAGWCPAWRLFPEDVA